MVMWRRWLFETVKPLDVFDKMSEHFSAMFVETEHFKPTHELYLILTKCSLYLDLSRPRTVSISNWDSRRCFLLRSVAMCFWLSCLLFWNIPPLSPCWQVWEDVWCVCAQRAVASQSTDAQCLQLMRQIVFGLNLSCCVVSCELCLIISPLRICWCMVFLNPDENSIIKGMKM